MGECIFQFYNIKDFNFTVMYDIFFSVEETETGPFDRFKDSEAVLNHFRTSLISGLKELFGHICSSRGEQEKKQTTLFLARVLQSLPVLVKTLTVSLQSPQGGKEEVQEFLVSSSTDLYSKWSKYVLEEFRWNFIKWSKMNQQRVNLWSI